MKHHNPGLIDDPYFSCSKINLWQNFVSLQCDATNFCHNFFSVSIFCTFVCMVALIETRKRLGLSQETLAKMLGVSRSHLSMAELGQRYLPPTALIQLARMVRSQESEQTPAAPPLSPADATRAEVLHSRWTQQLQDILRRLERLEQKLNRMGQAHSRSVRTLLLLKEEQRIFGNVTGYGQDIAVRITQAEEEVQVTHPYLHRDDELQHKLLCAQRDVLIAEIDLLTQD